MSFTQTMMSPGSWDIALKPTTPKSITDLCIRRNHIIATPQRLYDTGLGRSSLLGFARYTGVILDRSDDHLHLSGQSAMWWLGDGDSPPKGGYTAAVAGPKTWTQWVTALFPENGIAAGTSYSTPGTTINAENYGANDNNRQFFDRLRKVVPVEYRVNADATFDYGAKGGVGGTNGLFVVTTPTVILMRNGRGRANGYDGLNVERFEVGESGKDWANAFKVYSASYSASGAGTVAGEYGLDGSTLPTMRVVREVSSDDATDVTNAYAELADRYVDTTSVVAHVNEYDVCRYFTQGQPGDLVWVWDPINDLNDLTTAISIYYRGEMIPATKDYRLTEINALFQEGMGIYLLRNWGGSNEVVDLSDYVEWETGTSTLKLATRKELELAEAITGTTY